MLLFFAIESQYAALVVPSFDQGVLLVVILTTSLVMTASLIAHGSGIQQVPELDLEGALPNAPQSVGTVFARRRLRQFLKYARPGRRRIQP